jgi:hypothetical protein
VSVKNPFADTPFARLVRGLVERANGSFYEGPTPPERLRKIVAEFARLHPRATRAEWGEFCGRLTESAYQDGYVRGYERGERDPSSFLPTLPPELAAARHDPDWQLRSEPVEEVSDPTGVVQDEEIDAAEIGDPEDGNPGSRLGGIG